MGASGREPIADGLQDRKLTCAKNPDAPRGRRRRVEPRSKSLPVPTAAGHQASETRRDSWVPPRAPPPSGAQRRLSRRPLRLLTNQKSVRMDNGGGDGFRVWQRRKAYGAAKRPVDVYGGRVGTCGCCWQRVG